MNHNLYWESQKGGLCRLHALNAYFSYKMLQEEDFKKYCSDYDDYIKTTYKEIITSKNYDIFPVHTLIAYIIKRLENKYCYFIELDQLKKESHSLQYLVHKSTSFFVFTSNHIYTVRLNKGKWYKIDSMSGIVLTNLNKFNGCRTGFIIPRNTPDLDFDKLLIMTKIDNFLNKKNIVNKQSLVQWIIKNHKICLMDELEIYLGHLHQILKTQNKNLAPLDKLIRGFYHDKNNMKWIGKFLPRTLSSLGLITKLKPEKE